MPPIDIPTDLFQQIQQALPASGDTGQFVQQAVREKLAGQQRKAEFFQLSDLTRQALEERGISEADLLEDFDKQRRQASE